MNPSSDGCKCYDETVRPCPVHPVTHPIKTCPCGKLINEGDVTCPSCAPAYRAGMLRAAEIAAETTSTVNLVIPAKNIVVYGNRQADAIRKEAETI